ncbi:hypothetical protein GCM10010211_81380 [Streptomyces albospinus]|uniref:Uncharacterized protein n=1 Tax=Streptomyces albospinus TaxID=285515 RepID=A0ABQ2VRN6_9ACTN|nr:hypothetical protein GCM10010211_81380 [Streptomyces albospinus]
MDGVVVGQLQTGSVVQICGEAEAVGCGLGQYEEWVGGLAVGVEFGLAKAYGKGPVQDVSEGFSGACARGAVGEVGCEGSGVREDGQGAGGEAIAWLSDVGLSCRRGHGMRDVRHR